MSWKASATAALLIIATYGRADAEIPPTVRTLAPGVLRIGTYFVNPPFEHLSSGKKSASRSI